MSSRDLTVVRVDDLRALRESPPDDDLPDVHGAAGDPRYPSTSFLRMMLGFVMDLALHLGIATIVVLVAVSQDLVGWSAIGIFLGTFFGLSIVHRVFVQWLCHTTLGKWVTGLRVIREDTGGRPTLWLLTRAWLRGLWSTLELLNAG